MRRLIGISGEGPCSGKSTVGEIIRELTHGEPTRYVNRLFEPIYLHSPWRIKRFAEGPKKIASELTGIPEIGFNDQWLKGQNVIGWLNPQGLPVTYRDLLIKISEGMKEHICPDIWVNKLFNQWTDDSFWIIDDLRFANEMVRIRLEGGIIIYVQREQPNPEVTTISAEMADYVIVNDGSLEKLKQSVKEILEKEGII